MLEAYIPVVLFILVAIGYLMHGILGIAQNRGGHPGQLRESKKEATNSLISLGGLIALAEGKAQLAGSHLWDEESDTYNAAYIRRLLPGRRIAMVTLAHRRLGLIVPAGNPAGIQTPADLAKSGVKVIAAGDTVPITKYANQLVANLAKQPGYPADFVSEYTANIVSKQDNVAAVVAQIELGEGDAGIVYVTDAKTSTKVATIAVPAAANVPATYSGVVVKASANPAAAQAFLAWFAGPDGQAILASFGFLPAP